MQTYYNTTFLQGAELREAVACAKDQDRAVLLIFENTNRSFSPSEILRLIEKTGKKPPLTSIRRSITNLTKQGKLRKLNEMGRGLYGKPEHKWTRMQEVKQLSIV